jgi:hypothetical protein
MGSLMGESPTFLALEYSYDQAGRLWQVIQNGVLTATNLHDADANRTSVTTMSGTVSNAWTSPSGAMSPPMGVLKANGRFPCAGWSRVQQGS